MNETGNEVAWADRIVLGMTALFCLWAVLFLIWLLRWYVPAQAALLAGLGVQLPLPTRVAIAASNWFVRLFPLLILVWSVGGGFAAFVTWRWVWTERVRTETLGSAMFLGIGLAVAFASIVILVLTHMPVSLLLDSLDGS